MHTFPAVPKRETYNGNDPIFLEQVAQALDEFNSEEIHRLGSPGEDVMNNIVERSTRLLYQP